MTLGCTPRSNSITARWHSPIGPLGSSLFHDLAYLLVWAWSEHLQASKLKREKPADHLILILDEIESHLHPKWQRALLPALLGVAERLKSDLKIQILATHSPLILASLEPHFRQKGKIHLLTFEIVDQDRQLPRMPLGHPRRCRRLADIPDLWFNRSTLPGVGNGNSCFRGFHGWPKW